MEAKYYFFVVDAAPEDIPILGVLFYETLKYR